MADTKLRLQTFSTAKLEIISSISPLQICP
jgi:hypothetical protein